MPRIQFRMCCGEVCVAASAQMSSLEVADRGTPARLAVGAAPTAGAPFPGVVVGTVAAARPRLANGAPGSVSFRRLGLNGFREQGRGSAADLLVRAADPPPASRWSGQASWGPK